MLTRVHPLSRSIVVTSWNSHGDGDNYSERSITNNYPGRNRGTSSNHVADKYLTVRQPDREIGLPRGKKYHSDADAGNAQAPAAVRQRL